MDFCGFFILKLTAAAVSCKQFFERLDGFKWLFLMVVFYRA